MDHATIRDDWSERLEALSLQGLRRTLRTVESPQGARIRIDGREVINFASNDYLGLANHPDICEAARQAVSRWGWGAGSSRLVSGHMRPHAELEARLAAFKHTEAALVCSTGYQANLAAIRGLAGAGDVIFIDKLDHASIIDAAFAGGGAGRDAPAVRTFAHRDCDRLEQLLQRHRDARRHVIVTDSVFSMDGDLADLARLVEIKRAHKAHLCIDEAHATGVFGRRGAGLAEAMEVEDGIDVVVGTMSKAFGGIGGFIAGSRSFIDWLVNSARSFIYTTAMPPAACAAACAALDVIEREPERRQRLLKNAETMRNELTRRGYNIGPLACVTETSDREPLADRSRNQEGADLPGIPLPDGRGSDMLRPRRLCHGPGQSSSQIIPIIVGDSEKALGLSARLLDAGYLVPAIRPPTVPRGTARLRVSLTSEHTAEDLSGLLRVLP